MNLLILGGTQFVGRHIVSAALERGYQITLFSRGIQENPFPILEHLTGDRNGDLSALENRDFDALIDVSGYTPSQVERSCTALQARVKRYLFISTISVYAEPLLEGPIETSAVKTLEPDSKQGAEKVTPETYGALKALAENIVLGHFGEGATVVRPHFVVGSHDHTDRFTSWIHKFARGGEVLLGGSKETPCQFVDARDLAGLTLYLLENNLSGTFNAARDPVAWNDVLDRISTLTGNPIHPIEPSSDWLEAQQLEGGTFPMWIPTHSSESGFARVHNQRSRATGFVYRSLEDTLAHLLEWDRVRVEDLKAGLSFERQDELIQDWKARA